MRAVIIASMFACLGVASAGAGQIPAPVPKPLAETACPAGQVGITEAWRAAAATMADQRSGGSGVLIGGDLARQIMTALAGLTGKPVPPTDSIMMFAMGADRQIWILVSGDCSPSVLVIPKDLLSAVYKAMGQAV